MCIFSRVQCVYIHPCMSICCTLSAYICTHVHCKYIILLPYGILIIIHMCALMPPCVYTHISHVCICMHLSVLAYVIIYIYIYIFVCMCPHLAHTHTCTLPSVHLSAIAFTSHKCKCLCMHILPQTNGMQCPVSLPSLLSWGLTLKSRKAAQCLILHLKYF